MLPAFGVSLTCVIQNPVRSKHVADNTIYTLLEQMEINWAPFGVPLRRRRQTAAVVSLLAIPLFMLAAQILLFSVNFGFSSRALRALWLAYVAWFLIFDRTTPTQGGRLFAWLPAFCWWKYAREYFPAELHFSSKRYPDSACIYGVHPHG